MLFDLFIFSAIGVVCFNAELGLISSDPRQNDEGTEMLTATKEMFDAVQNTLFAFPFYNLFRSKRYQQYYKAKTITNRYNLTIG